MQTQRNGLIILNNEHLGDAQENTNIRLIEMRKTICYLKMKFNKEIQTLYRTKVEMKMELKNSIHN